jgi:serine/threonine-protein kinase
VRVVGKPPRGSSGQEASLMAGLEGTTLGPYQIMGLLGAGGMGQVYRAYDPRLEREVAIKVLAATHAQEPGYLERFRREARAVAQLNHPHIVQVYDFGEQGDLTYLVMPLIANGTLRDRLAQQGALPLPEALSLFEQLAAALQYAHARGLIHRDVKPANVLLSAEGGAMLTDFGIVRLTHRAPEATTLTNDGAFVGSPAYAAPEMVLGEAVDQRVDIYALGVSLFQMLTGRLPFVAPLSVSLLVMQVQQQPPRPRSLNPSIPPAVEAVILQALAKAPAERHQSMAAFAAALRAACDDQATDAAQEPTIEAQTPQNLHTEPESAAPESETAIVEAGQVCETASVDWTMSPEKMAELHALIVATGPSTLPSPRLTRKLGAPPPTASLRWRLLSILLLLAVAASSAALALGVSQGFFPRNAAPTAQHSARATATPPSPTATPSPTTYYEAHNFVIMNTDLPNGERADHPITIQNADYLLREGSQGDLYQMGDALTFGRVFGVAQLARDGNGAVVMVVLVDRFATYQDANKYFMRDQALIQGQPTTMHIGEEAAAGLVPAANGQPTYQLFFRDRNIMVTIAIVQVANPQGVNEYAMDVGEALAQRGEHCLYNPLTLQAIAGNPNGCA